MAQPLLATPSLGSSQFAQSPGAVAPSPPTSSISAVGRDLLIQQEGGSQLVPYKDTENNWTAGVGHNLGKALPGEPAPRPITAEQSANWLRQDIDSAERDVSVLTEVRQTAPLTQARRDVLTNMAHNLGRERLSGFDKMWTALSRGDYDKAATEILDSKYAQQVKGRAKTLATIMRTGEYARG